ncbi:MAG TPA: hypothetical protein VFH02_03595 [Jiangellaceae bacterium]|nr:hypothetical protein [Jiangellaceae bacterium]
MTTDGDRSDLSEDRSGVPSDSAVTIGDSAATYKYDVSQVETPQVPTVDLVSVGEAEEFERQIRGRQEWVRTALAVGAFLSLVLILALLLVAVYSDVTTANIEQVATVVVTPLTGIVGTIIGFYFAERRGGGRES